jgi:hypothetical protein
MTYRIVNQTHRDIQISAEDTSTAHPDLTERFPNNDVELTTKG